MATPTFPRALAAVLLLLGTSGRTIHGAGDAPLDRATLAGIKAVNIVIDSLNPELEKAGLNATSLAARLQSRLEQGGVPVDDKAVEFAGVRLIQVRDRRGPYAVAITLGLYQPVLLVRDQNRKTATQTWEVETILLSDPKSLVEASLSSLDELADRFAAAWHSANPEVAVAAH
jgi:hypothetical protein